MQYVREKQTMSLKTAGSKSFAGTVIPDGALGPTEGIPRWCSEDLDIWWALWANQICTPLWTQSSLWNHNPNNGYGQIWPLETQTAPARANVHTRRATFDPWADMH